MQNPVYLTARQAANDMVRYAAEFGLSPLPVPASPPASTKKRPRASSTASSPVKRTADGKRRAQRVIDFIEQLTVPSGKGQGKPFKLRKLQKDYIRDIYEPHRNGKRVVRRAILSMARKNGKTALIAAIALAHLVGPEAIVHGEIYSAANDRDQAAIVFKFARQMVELEPDLRKQIEIIQSTKTMVARRTASIYRAISAEAGTKHGYVPSVVIYDELAQAKSRDLYDVLDTSFGARDEPLFIIMSTQSNDPEHIMSKLIDDGLAEIDPSICLSSLRRRRGLRSRRRGAMAQGQSGARRLSRLGGPGLGDTQGHAIAGGRAEGSKPVFEPEGIADRHTDLARGMDGMRRRGQHRGWQEVYLGLDLANVIDLAALTMITAEEPVQAQAFFWKPAAHAGRSIESRFRIRQSPLCRMGA